MTGLRSVLVTKKKAWIVDMNLTSVCKSERTDTTAAACQDNEVSFATPSARFSILAANQTLLGSQSVTIQLPHALVALLACTPSGTWVFFEPLTEAEVGVGAGHDQISSLKPGPQFLLEN